MNKSLRFTFRLFTFLVGIVIYLYALKGAYFMFNHAVHFGVGELGAVLVWLLILTSPIWLWKSVTWLVGVSPTPATPPVEEPESIQQENVGNAQ